MSLKTIFDLFREKTPSEFTLDSYLAAASSGDLKRVRKFAERFPDMVDAPIMDIDSMAYKHRMPIDVLVEAETSGRRYALVAYFNEKFPKEKHITKTAISMAVLATKLDVVAYLLDRNVDVNQSINGLPLIACLACVIHDKNDKKRDCTKIIQTMLSKGARLDYRNLDGDDIVTMLKKNAPDKGVDIIPLLETHMQGQSQRKHAASF